MKKKFCFFVAILLIVGYVYSQDNSRDIFLDNYFDYQEYKIESHHFSNFDFYFAYNVLDNKQGFFTKAILFRKNNKTIEPIGYIQGNKIFNGERLLFSGVIHTQQFAGWKITVVDRNNSIATVFYTNNGENMTEGPLLIWKNDMLVQYVIDTSML